MPDLISSTTFTYVPTPTPHVCQKKIQINFPIKEQVISKKILVIGGVVPLFFLKSKSFFYYAFILASILGAKHLKTRREELKRRTNIESNSLVTLPNPKEKSFAFGLVKRIQEPFGTNFNRAPVVLLNILKFLNQFTLLYRPVHLDRPSSFARLSSDKLLSVIDFLPLKNVFTLLRINKFTNATLHEDPYLWQNHYQQLKEPDSLKAKPPLFSSKDLRKAVYPQLEDSSKSKQWLSAVGKVENALLTGPHVQRKRFELQGSKVTALHIGTHQLTVGDNAGNIKCITKKSQFTNQIDSEITHIQSFQNNSYFITTYKGEVSIFSNNNLRINNMTRAPHPITKAQMHEDYYFLAHEKLEHGPHSTIWHNSTITPFLTMSPLDEIENQTITSFQWDHSQIYMTLDNDSHDDRCFYLWDIRDYNSVAMPIIKALKTSTLPNQYNKDFHKVDNDLFFACDEGIIHYDIRKPNSFVSFLPTNTKISSLQADNTKVVASTSSFNHDTLSRTGSILLWDKLAYNSGDSSPKNTYNFDYGISLFQYSGGILAVGSSDSGILEVVKASYF